MDEKTTVMPYAWGIVGHDRFDNTYYPKSIVNSSVAARSAAYNLNRSQAAKQPGGLHDTFEAMPLGEAARLCEMTVEEFVAFVEKVANG